MKLFLHIGLDKIGASSLQTFCNQHRQMLREKGLEHPESGIHNSAHYGVSKRLIGLPAAPKVALAEGLGDEMKSAIVTDRDILVSSEYFSLARDKQGGQIEAFFAGFNL